MAAIGSAAAPCFHCGQSIPAGARYGVRVDDSWQAVCCAGCEAVASAILGQGFGDFYRLRDRAPGERARVNLTEDLALYDDPDVQRGFVVERDTEREALLVLEGIRCVACSWLVEQALARLPGVLSAEVNYATQRARVRWDPERVHLSVVMAAAGRIGYRAFPCNPAQVESVQRSERRGARWRLFVAGFGMMQVMMYALPVYLAGEGEMSGGIEQLMRWASLALTLPVVGFAAAPFFAGAWRDLRSRQLGVDVPVALGIGIAFGASVVATLAGSGNVYFDSVAMFVFLLLLGRYLELLARQRSTLALQHLGRLIPEFAHRLRDFPGSLDTERVAVAALKPGDLALVKPGEPVPADGIIEQGVGSVSEALLSGEAKPVEKGPGNGLIGGSVNLASPFVMRVEKVGAATVLSSVLRLIERAASEKPRLVRLADRTASLFILMVLVLASIAGVFWAVSEPGHGLLVAISVLVATCPCALSLATPVALSVATGELARRGVAIARGHTVEALAGVTDIVFDKTGTLTHGDLRVEEVCVHGDLPLERCLAIAAALESASEHPLGKAIATAGAILAKYPLEDLRNVPGAGVEARIDGHRYRIGSPAFALELAGKAAAVQGGGTTIVSLANESGLLASFRLADRIRSEAAGVVDALKERGIAVHLLSGDGEAATQSAAARAGIGKVLAQATPERKLRYVAGLQRRGRKVAMVGDGINDAPVLAQADVSLAMGRGARLAQAQADAVILSGSLVGLPDALAYARLVLRIVRQNIAWAFAYNLLVLPIAVAGALTPWAAAIGMSGSSLLVVLNALRLERGRRESGEPAARPAAALSAR
jgi:P-type Cu2+ transporter